MERLKFRNKSLPSLLSYDNIQSDHKFLDRLSLIMLVLFISIPPLLFKKELSDFANLPKSAFIQVGVLFILLLWFSKNYYQKILRISWSLLYVPILGFLFWSALSLFWAHNKYEGIVTLSHWVACALSFFIVFNTIKNEKEASWILAGLFFSGIIVSVLGILQYLFNITWIPQVVPPASTFANKNMAVHFVILTIPIGAFFFLVTRKRIIIWLTSIASCLMLVFLIYSSTRAGWVALTMQILMLLFMILNDRFRLSVRPHWDRLKTFSMIVSTIVFFLMINLSSEGFIWKIEKIYERGSSILPSFITNSPHSTPNPRITIWRDTIELIKDHPLIGVGVGNFATYFPIYSENVNEETQISRAHNDYLQTVVELGIVGMILFGLLAFTIVWISLKLLAPDNSTIIRYMVMSLCMAIAGLIINAFFCFPFQRAIPPYVLMIYFGILGALFRNLSETNRQFTSIKSQKCFPLKNLRIYDSNETFIFPHWISFISVTLILISLIFVTRIEYRRLIADKYFLRALSAEKAKIWHKVISEGEKAYYYDPHRKEILSLIGRGYLESGIHAKAIRPLLQATYAYPYTINHTLNLGLAYENNGQFDKALEYYKRTLIMQPNYAKAHAHIAAIYLKQKNYDDAVDSSRLAVKCDPKNYIYQFNLGIVSLNKKYFQEARDAFQKSLEFDPKLDVAHKYLGLILLQHFKEKENGLNHLKKALELNPNIKDADEIKQLVGKI